MDLKFAIGVIGLFFAYYLHTRTIKRAEIARNKEQAVKYLKDFPDWASKLAKDFEPNELQFEEYISAHSSIIEFQINNLNHLVGCTILEPKTIANLRNLNFHSYKTNSDFNFAAFQVCANLIGKIEDNYSIHLFHNNFIKRLVSKRKDEILGFTCAASFVSLFLMLFNMFD